MPSAESVQAARDAVASRANKLGLEEVPTAEAVGRVLASDVATTVDLPPFASAAMDGYASLPAPAGALLEIIGESRAGHPFTGTLSEGEAIAISTGAVAPSGVGVAPIEVVSVDDEVAVTEVAVECGQHVRLAGEDMPAGTVALSAGTLLAPSHLQVAAACGVASLKVSTRPKVAIVATGDELVSSGGQLQPGQIHESNGVGLRALAEAVGCEVVSVVRCADELAATSQALAAALETADIVIASGGVSVGEHDHVRPALSGLGVEEVFWRVPLKPGGPTWFGAGESGQLVFGLPGNPASAYVTFCLFAQPAVRAMLGLSPYVERWPAKLTDPVQLRNREQAIRVTLSPNEEGILHATPTGAQGSHRTASLAGAWGIAMLQPGEGDLTAGKLVDVEPLP